MHFDESEHVYFIGKVIGVVNDEDIAEQEDIDKYLLAASDD